MIRVKAMTIRHKAGKGTVAWRRLRLTFMVVPDGAGRIVSWRCSAFRALAFAVLGILVLCGALASYGWAAGLLATVHTQRAEIATLTEEKGELQRLAAEHAERVAELEKTAKEVAERIARLKSLEQEIREIIPSASTAPLPASKERHVAAASRSGGPVEATRESGTEELSGIGGGEDTFPGLGAWVSTRLSDLSERFQARSRDLEQLQRSLEAHNHRLMHTPFGWPVDGRVTSTFGMRRHPISGNTQHHDGIDIAAPVGTPVRATGAGTVVLAQTYGGYGRAVIIDHGYQTRTLYGHNSRLHVRVGQRVERGQIIAEVGNTGYSTGPHLHYEVVVRGRVVDPMPFINGIDR